jgi:hypothetical protein
MVTSIACVPRTLEKECGRNIELMWLGEAFYRSIPLPILERQSKWVFVPVKLASHFELIGGSLVAGDSTKLRPKTPRK